ncbi:MAG: hypothetical protein ACAI44_25575 [Candidatus Sericytochromatia bacterium]
MPRVEKLKTAPLVLPGTSPKPESKTDQKPEPKPEIPGEAAKPEAGPAEAAKPNPAPAEALAVSPGMASGGQASSTVSLGFDDSKATVSAGTTRFPQRGREINVPLFSFDASGAKLVNPLPASGLALSDKEKGGLILKGTPDSPARIFAAIDAPSQAVAALYDHLAHKYPELEKNILWRLAKVSTYVAIDVPLMVAGHEMGHGAAALASCPMCDPQVTMTNWMSGYTSYNTPDDYKLTLQQDLFNSVAGMNQATYTGEEIDRRMHTQGADLKDAIGYLANITNSMNYQFKDWIKNTKPGYNDASTYFQVMEERQKGWNRENLSMLALGVNLLNADFWASLIGSANYIATGKEVKMPELKIGQFGISAPHLSLIHTYEGPQLNTSIYAHHSGPETLELKYSQLLTPDLGPGFGVEARLYNVAIPGTTNQLFLSPRAGVSVHDQEVGFKTGLELEYRPAANPYLSLTTGLDYRSNYLPDVYQPKSSGLQGTAGMKISFW